MNRSIVPAVEVNDPAQSTFFAFSRKGDLCPFEGKYKYARIAFTTPNGASNQKKPLHVAFVANADARNGPTTQALVLTVYLTNFIKK